MLSDRASPTAFGSADVSISMRRKFVPNQSAARTTHPMTAAATRMQRHVLVTPASVSFELLLCPARCGREGTFRSFQRVGSRAGNHATVRITLMPGRQLRRVLARAVENGGRGTTM